ncbi:MAG: hypothetical protein PHS53_05095 [Candidatus Pacebacteria bacterium]|nr:hypothetical protein [Candidatus Paceibacterota bacterium]
MWHSTLKERTREIGLVSPRYDFLLAPRGFPVSQKDLEELSRIGKTAMVFLHNADVFFKKESASGSSQWAGMLRKGIPPPYLPLLLRDGLPQTVMIDTIWTEDGWRIVEIDAVNRNGLAYPPVLRYLYGGMKCLWKGNEQAWKDAGFEGMTQVMGEQYRFYEPYYRFFLKMMGGTLVPELSIESMDGQFSAESLLDVPILHRSDPTKLIALAEKVKIGIPPKHHLSSKATLALPWEREAEFSAEIKEFLPETKIIHRKSIFPKGDFFVKHFQSGGAHGTFFNDQAKLEAARVNRPFAIWQRALPIAKREVQFLDTEQTEKTAELYVRFSLYVDLTGEIVDADVTASDSVIVHGGRQSVMTIPVLES